MRELDYEGLIIDVNDQLKHIMKMFDVDGVIFANWWVHTHTGNVERLDGYTVGQDNKFTTKCLVLVPGGGDGNQIPRSAIQASNLIQPTNK